MKTIIVNIDEPSLITFDRRDVSLEAIGKLAEFAKLVFSGIRQGLPEVTLEFGSPPRYLAAPMVFREDE